MKTGQLLTSSQGDSDAAVAAGEVPSGNLGDLTRRLAGDERVSMVDFAAGGEAKIRSYRQFDLACDAVAQALADCGLGSGDRIAILSLNSSTFVAVLFGAMRAGCVPVPVNVKLAAPTIAFILEDAGVRLAYGEAAFRHVVPDQVPFAAMEDAWRADARDAPFASVPVTPETVSMQPYTAGTTGRPKGVLLTHSGQLWAARALAAHRRVSAQERMLISAPFFHKNAIVAMKTALATGAALVILPKFDAAASVDAIEQHRCTTITGVPTMMHLIIAEIERRGACDLSSVTTISIGSAPASPTLLGALERTFPGARVHLNYGLTEGGPISFGWFHPDGLERPVESIGYPMADCELRFVDGPDEHEGELWVRNPGIPAGYHNLPDETAERFVDGWCRTGDIVRQDADGWCYFLGRVDDMFVCGGENIYPQEVEKMLETHRDIAQAVVLDFPHELKGRVPYAFVATRPGAALDEAGVKTYARANGPAYAHPRRVFFLREIPLTGANKVDRQALKKWAEAHPDRSAEDT